MLNFFRRAVHVWLAGVLFLLFMSGYVLYAVLWVIRYFQTRKKLLYGVLPVFVFTALAAYYLLFPLYGRHDPVTMVIPRGYTLSAIADTLYKQDIVQSKQALVAWLRVSGTERRIQAGKFSFLTHYGVVAAASALNKPLPLDRTVTIPEGLTIEQTAEHIGRTFTIDTAEFVRLCRDPVFLQGLGLDSAQSAEGYLFPDTYSFHEATGPEEMIRRMVGKLNEEWMKLDPAAAPGGKYTKREKIIVASIVEKEGLLVAELPRIAGVFYNRLSLGMPLGADPTVRYIFKKWNGPLYNSELKNRSPYNTRIYRGLPPGPICSPGRAALAAAVSPAKTNELYFVAKWDGSGGHEFSVSHEDHVRKKNAIRQNNELRNSEKEASCRN